MASMIPARMDNSSLLDTDLCKSNKYLDVVPKVRLASPFGADITAADYLVYGCAPRQKD